MKQVSKGNEWTTCACCGQAVYVRNTMRVKWFEHAGEPGAVEIFRDWAKKAWLPDDGQFGYYRPALPRERGRNVHVYGLQCLRKCTKGKLGT